MCELERRPKLRALDDAKAWPIGRGGALCGGGAEHEVSGRIVGRARIGFDAELHVTEPKALKLPHEARDPRAQGDPPDLAGAPSLTVDDHPVLAASLDPNARRANTRVIDNRTAVRGASDVETITLERDALLHGADAGARVGRDDEKEAHGGSLGSAECFILCRAVWGALGCQ
jgi:hypothetical protein